MEIWFVRPRKESHLSNRWKEVWGNGFNRPLWSNGALRCWKLLWGFRLHLHIPFDVASLWDLLNFLKDLFISIWKVCREKSGGRQTHQRERDSPILPSAGSLHEWLQDWSRRDLEPGVELPPGLAHGGRCPRPWAIFHCFPTSWAGSCIKSGAAGTWTVTHMGCWCCGVGDCYTIPPASCSSGTSTSLQLGQFIWKIK